MGGRTQKKKSKAARRGAAASSNLAKAQEPEPQPEPEPGIGPGALPLPRSMILTRDDDGNDPGLRVVTYNILAQAYFENNPRQQATCPAGKRGQKARHAALMNELDLIFGDVGAPGGAGTAVLAMQEVEATYLDSLLRPALEERGFTVLFKRKVGGTEASDLNRRLEGVSLCWRGCAIFGPCVSGILKNTFWRRF